MYIATKNQMNLLDKYTIETLGLPGVVLMENAGFAVVQEIIADYPNQKPDILVLAGGGNNGGDGFVIARRLRDLGFRAKLYLTVSKEQLTGDARVHFEVYENRKLPLFEYTVENHEQLLHEISHCDVIVDSLLGTGMSGEVRSPMKDIIQLVNASKKMVYAVDIPSGLNADTGEVTNLAIVATKTVTFAMPKIGFFVGSGPQFIGEWKVVDISVPQEIAETLQMDLPVLLDEETAKQAVPKRPSHGHKGTFGHCLVIGGCVNYVGAPLYTAKAAFHTGVGLVSLAIPDSIYSIIASQCPESLLMPLPSLNGSISEHALDELDVNKFQAIAFGPGIGRNLNGARLLETLLSKCSNQTLIIDADGLYFLRNHLSQIHDYEGAVIITPHPGEMASLIGSTVAEVEKDRLTVAKHFATKNHVYVLLKGHRPILATPNGDVWVNPHGNDALGKGGSGDVLTGILTSFVTQGATASEAMQAASFYHARAAEELARERSTYGITPMDIIQWVSRNL